MRPQCERPVLLNLFIKTNFKHVISFGVNGVLDQLVPNLNIKNQSTIGGTVA